MIVTALGLHRLLPRRLRANLLLGFHWDHSERRSVPDAEQRRTVGEPESNRRSGRL